MSLKSFKELGSLLSKPAKAEPEARERESLEQRRKETQVINRQEVALNNHKKIVVSTQMYREREYLDIRLWVRNDDTQEFKETKNGVTLPVNRTGPLVKAIKLVHPPLPKATEEQT